MNAIFFDIDGTLLNSHGLGRHAFEQALRICSGINSEMSQVDWLGRTDTDIISLILCNEGFDTKEISDFLPGFFKVFVRLFKEFTVNNRELFEILPGVIEILSALKDKPIGLLTGNVMEAAYMKLQAAGIDGFFPYGIGGFGDEARDRRKLIPLALIKMKKYYSIENFDKVIMIGDSHRDIDCAKANSAVSLAVATGKLSIEELRNYHPDFIFENLLQINEILKILQ